MTTMGTTRRGRGGVYRVTWEMDNGTNSALAPRRPLRANVAGSRGNA